MAYNSFQKNVNSPTSYYSNSGFSCSEIGCYSIDDAGRFYNNDRRELRRLKPSYMYNQGMDLSNGFTHSKGSEAAKNIKRQLDAFLHWIVNNKANVLTTDTRGNKRLDFDFVITRGTMKLLLKTVFDTGNHKSPWTMYAVKYNGTIYISHVENRPGTDMQFIKNAYMAKQFEEVMTEPSQAQYAAQSRGTGATVEARPGFYTVSRGTFGGRHRVLTRSQVDCMENNEYIELKLSKQYSGRDEWKFPMYKLREWWYHIYAGNMKKIVYGIRDESRLASLSSLGINSIPSQVKPRMSCPPAIQQALTSWNPNCCVGFVEDFLQWLKETIVEDAYTEQGPVMQYQLKWEVGWQEAVSYRRVEAARCEYDLLPIWFTNEMSSAFRG